MARVPGLGPVKSRLLPALTPAQATLLYRCFLLDRLDAVLALPGVAPVVAFTPAHGRARMAALAPPGVRLVPQPEGDLGARLHAVLGGLLAQGHAGALALDSDSPTLPMAYVAEAARVLREGRARVILGPAEDGGYYLVGLAAPAPALFRDIPWSTPRVLPVTLERARELGLGVHLLPPGFDVDTAEDLRRLRERLGEGAVPRRTRCWLEAHPAP
jgi:hypothetical protein